MPISVGSVEVDVLPNAQGIQRRLQQALVPPATQVGDEVGRIIGRLMAAQIAAAVRDGVTNGGRAARPAAARQGDETGGAFSRSLKARLEAAFRSLPKADVGLSTTGFDADMARLRARLETLSGKRIGIDVDAGVALAEITDVEARLRRLGAEHPNIQVRADTAAALAQLAALRAEVDAVDGKKVDVDTSSAASSFNALTAAAVTFGPAIIPALAVVAAGLGAVAAAGAAAAAGVGSVALVAVPAFKQISAVLQAQKAAQQAATNATYQGGQASQSAAGSVDQAAVAQDKYRAALAKLTPAARATLNAFVALRSGVTAWSKSLQPAVMPIFTRALVAMRNVLPTLTPFALSAAAAIGVLLDKVSAQARTPFWQGFRKDLQGAVTPAIIGLGVAFGNVIKGMAGVVDAFLPHMDSISSRMQTITARFANWGASLKGSPAFEHFLSYASQQAPILARALGALLGTFLAVSKAVAPLSNVVLAATLPMLNALAWLAAHVPGVIQLLWGLYVANKAVAVGMKLWAAGSKVFGVAMGIYNAAVALATLETWSWAAAIQATGIVPLIELIVVAIIALGVAVYEAYQHVGWFRTAVDVSWTAIKAATAGLWTALQVVFSAIWTALKAVGAAAVWLWKNAIGPAFRFIWGAAKILFTVMVVGVLLPIIAVFKVLSAGAMALWRVGIRPAFQGIGALAKWLYRSVIKPQFASIGAAFRGAATIAQWLYSKGIKPAFQGIATAAGWLYNKGIKPQFDLMAVAARKLGESFKSAKDFIGKQWSQVSGLTKKPVKFVVDTVYNSAIVPLWNKVASVVDAKKLTKLNVKGFAGGGILPGYTPGRDVHHFMSPTGGALALSGGEAIMRPEFTRAVGPAAVGALNAAARSGGVAGVRQTLGFADGGIIGNITDAIRKGINWAKTGASILADPGKVWSLITAPVRHLFGQAGSSKWAKLVAQMPAMWLKSMKEKLVDSVGLSGGSVGGTIPSGNRLAVINQALAAAGVPPPGVLGQWQAGLNTLISRESGWNPNAINRWDSNAKAGHPSQGLAQTIPGTFNAYVPASLRGKGILNPVANVAAAIRYIVSRYGNITNVQQANANKPPAGYDNGGFLQPGLNLAYNGTGRPEPVYTTAQANALTSLAGGQSAGAGPASFQGDLYLDSGEFLGRVRGEAQQVVNQNNGQLLTALGARPRG